MKWRSLYERGKPKLLNTPAICRDNRELFRKFFEHEEYKLKRMNGLSELDEQSSRTLVAYLSRLRVVNRWFENKPWKGLSHADIKRVYDAVEDGEIKTMAGKPYRDAETMYSKIWLGKPFELAGKTAIVKPVLEYRKKKQNDVRFIREADFRRIVDVTPKLEHKAFLWLAWDIGENAGALLQVRSSDCVRRVNEHSREAEFSVVLRREILKRSRTPRTEITNYRETVEFLDLLTRSRSASDLLFEFGTRMGMKLLDRATRITGVRCIPGGQKVTLKDLRSSMACDLLSKGWTTDEVNQRLGHKPSSREIDKYVNWLALDRHKPKRRFHESQVRELEQQLTELKEREKLAQQRHFSLQDEVTDLRQQMEQRNRELHKQLFIVSKHADGPIPAQLV